jgi:hypothetical protein
MPLPKRRTPELARLLIGVLQRLRNQANPEYRLSGFIQQFQLPLGVFGELAGNVRDHVPADAGHFLPGGIVIDKLRAVIADACILAMSNAEEEDGRLNQVQKGPPSALGLKSGWSGFLAGGKINSGFLRAHAR